MCHPPLEPAARTCVQPTPTSMIVNDATAADVACKPVIRFPTHPFADLRYRTPLTHRPPGCAATATAVYAFALVLLVLAGATMQVLLRGLAILEGKDELNLVQDVVLGLAIFGFALVGVFGFHRSWAPVTARRCFVAGYAVNSRPCSCGSVATAALAPLFAMGYMFAPRRRLLASYALTAFVAGAVLALTLYVPAPWRQIVDCGVALGLSLGTLALGSSRGPRRESSAKMPSGTPRPSPVRPRAAY